jgi:hypothetical protein
MPPNEVRKPHVQNPQGSFRFLPLSLCLISRESDAAMVEMCGRTLLLHTIVATGHKPLLPQAMASLLVPRRYSDSTVGMVQDVCRYCGL